MTEKSLSIGELVPNAGHSRVRAERPCAGLGAGDTVRADKGADVRVGELMTTDPVTTTVDTPLKEAARLMLTHRISGLPVVDADPGLGPTVEHGHEPTVPGAPCASPRTR